MIPTVILKYAFVHPPQVCMGTGHKCHRMDGSPKSSTRKTHSRDRWHMGTLPRPCRLSPSRYGRFVPQSIALSWVSTSMLYLPSPHCPSK